MILAIAILPIGVIAGAAIDFSRAESNGTDLRANVDSAALATARYAMDNPDASADDIIQFGNTYLANSFQPDDSKTLEAVLIDVVPGESVSIAAESTIQSTMLGLASIDSLTSRMNATASFGTPSGLRAVLVLDNSNSMEGGKMAALQDAAETFVDELMLSEDDFPPVGDDDDEDVGDDDDDDDDGDEDDKTLGGESNLEGDDDEIGGDDDDGSESSTFSSDFYVGVVPFSHYVNVGMDQEDAAWLSVPDPKSSKTESCSVDSDASSSAGCVQESYACTKTSDGVEYDSTCWTWTCPEGVSTVQTCSDVTTEKNWCGAVTQRADPYHLTDADYDSEPVYGYLSSGTWECNTPIKPMTNDKEELLEYFDTLEAKGDTYIAPGLMWGYRLLTPGAPFTEMQGKDSRSPAIILMSDGMNSRSFRDGDPSGDHYGSSKADANAATLATCDFIKSNGVSIYAIAFQVDDNDTEDMLKTCATSFTHYFNADSYVELNDAFSSVAASFSEVALTQ